MNYDSYLATVRRAELIVYVQRTCPRLNAVYAARAAAEILDDWPEGCRNVWVSTHPYQKNGRQHEHAKEIIDTTVYYTYE